MDFVLAGSRPLVKSCMRSHLVSEAVLRTSTERSTVGVLSGSWSFTACAEVTVPSWALAVMDVGDATVPSDVAGSA